MPLLEFSCKKHGSYEVLTTIKHDLACPKCGTLGKRLFTPPRLPDTVYTSTEEQNLKDQFAKENKDYYESHADDIRKGKMDIKGSNPRGYEPDLGKRVY